MNSADDDGGAGDAASPPRSVIEAAEVVDAAQPHVLAHARYGIPESPTACMAMPAEIGVVPPQEGPPDIGAVPSQEGPTDATSAVGVVPPQEGPPDIDMVSPKEEPIDTGTVPPQEGPTEATTADAGERTTGTKSPPRSTVESTEPKRSKPDKTEKTMKRNVQHVPLRSFLVV